MSEPKLEDNIHSYFFVSSRRRHTSSVSAFLLNRSSDLAEGRKANDSHADCHQYFCVPEYGTANGRLHFHAVHFMRRSEERRVGKECCYLWSALHRSIDRADRSLVIGHGRSALYTVLMEL